MGDPNFKDFLSLFDLILLQETWMQEQFYLEGFNGSMLPAFKNQRFGRPQAGLAMLWSTKSKLEVLFLRECNHMAQAFLLKGAGKSFIIINVYVPPSTVKDTLSQYWEGFCEYLGNLEKEFPNVDIVLAGDFNARIGQNGAELADKLGMDSDDLLPNCFFNLRGSKDSHINVAGTYLAQLSLRFNLVILNGLPPFDLSSEFTYVSSRGCSVVDYVLISPTVYDNVRAFSIMGRVESDHFPLGLILNFPSPFLAHPDSWEAVGGSVSDMPRIHWSNKVAQKTAEILDPHCLEEFLLLSKELFQTSELFLAYDRIITKLVEALRSQPDQPPHVRKTFVTGWFDRECCMMKAQVRSIYQHYRESSLEYPPKEYFEAKAELHRLCKDKHKASLQKSWEPLLHATLSNNTRKFWVLISDALGRNCSIKSPITTNSWYEYFLKIFLVDRDNEVEEPVVILGECPVWLPVEVEEVKILIAQIKTGKAAGPDAIPPEVIKSFPEWWAPFLAALFTSIDQTGEIPETWTNAIVVPIFKKGDCALPENYRPISLLSIIGKLYARHLANKLKTWMLEEQILGIEQAGFCQGKSTLDHCIVLSHLVNKYHRGKGCKLIAAFLDLKGAFDSVSRDLLWKKLRMLGIDSRLLFLIKKLHTDTTCQVRGSRRGDLTPKIPINIGVKQGCILAPLLFNLFLNDLASFLKGVEGHSPILGARPVPLLLYADDAVVLSRSEIGLKRLLASFLDYCELNGLFLNFKKSKIMAFENCWKPANWNIRGKVIEQVKSFKYLGVNFHFSSRWVAHRLDTIKAVNCSALAITRFFYTKGNQYIPAVLRLFNQKIGAKVLYGIPIWITAFNKTVEQIQSSFLRKILGLPSCVSYAAMCLETNQRLLETKAWIITIKFWLRIHFRSSPNSLISHMLMESQSSAWLAAIEKKLAGIGYSLDVLTSLPEKSIFALIKQRLLDLELQDLRSLASGSCSPLRWGYICNGSPAQYFFSLTSPQLRRAFMLARFNVLPSAVLSGRFKKVPYSLRFCVCDAKVTESIEHVLLYCRLYDDIRAAYLEAFLYKAAGQSDVGKAHFLLSSQNPEVTELVAEFFCCMVKRRERF